MDDSISRQAVLDMLDEIEGEVMDGEGYKYGKWSEYVEQLPSAQPERDEWCSDCKEYDSEKHCCPRFNRVIRTALKDAQSQRMRGRWVEHKWAEEVEGLLISNYACSCCSSWERTNSDYCPNCGADMREGQDGSD